MFGNKKSIIYIKETSIEVSKVSLEKEDKVEKTESFDLKEMSYGDIFDIVRKNYGKEVRVLFSEEKSYCFKIDVPDSNNDIRKKISIRLSEIVPENPEQVYFDWKELESNKEKVSVQVFAINKEYLNEIIRAAETSGLFVEAFEPVSYALLRLTEGYKDAQLLLLTDSKPIAVVIEDGSVLVSSSIDSFSEIKSLLAYVKDRLSKDVKRIVIAEKIKKGAETLKKTLKIDVELMDLNPVIGIARKTDLRGKDAAVLNYDYEDLIDELPKDSSEKTKAEKNQEEENKDNESEKEDKKDEKLGKEEKSTKVGVSDIQRVTLEEDGEEEKKKASKKKIGKGYLYVLFIVLVVGIALIGYIVYSHQGEETSKIKPDSMKNSETSSVQDDVAEPDVGENAQEDEVTTQHNLKIEFLVSEASDGSGREIVAFLEEMDYKALSFSSPTDLSQYTANETSIEIKKSRIDFMKPLIADLKASGYASEFEIKTLDESSQNDVIIILQKVEESENSI